MSNNCGQCSIPAHLRCGRCKCVFYCSIQCQKSHWVTHKTSCIDCSSSLVSSNSGSNPGVSTKKVKVLLLAEMHKNLDSCKKNVMIIRRKIKDKTRGTFFCVSEGPSINEVYVALKIPEKYIEKEEELANPSIFTKIDLLLLHIDLMILIWSTNKPTNAPDFRNTPIDKNYFRDPSSNPYIKLIEETSSVPVFEELLDCVFDSKEKDCIRVVVKLLESIHSGLVENPDNQIIKTILQRLISSSLETFKQELQFLRTKRQYDYTKSY